jgi:hypothetical protein
MRISKAIISLSAHDPRVVAARERIKRFGMAATMNLQKLVADRPV